MRFFDAWTQLSASELLGWLAPGSAVTLLVFLPGRMMARIGAAMVAGTLLLAPDALLPPELKLGWAALWGLGAWTMRSAPAGRGGARVGLLESGTIGLLLALALLTLLVVAIARADLPPDAGRRVSYGVVILCLGLLHLMLRRHTVRLAFGLGILGLGLQILERAAHDAGPDTGATPPTILLATALAGALAVRAGRTRERVARSPWVSDAHDLHD